MSELKGKIQTGATLQGSISGGGGGTLDHAALLNRDKPGQHPIDAVTGLREVIDNLPSPMTAQELRDILTKENG